MLAYERKRAEWGNKTPGTLPGYDCPECLNRGYHHVVDDRGRHFTRECRCMARRRYEKRLEKSGLGDLARRYTLERWETREPWQQRAKALAEAYAKAKSGWFVAAGSVGAGKTHLCTALCGLLLRDGVEVRYMLWREAATRAKALVNDETAYRRLVEPLKQVPCLYIDDLFKTGGGAAPSTGDLNLAFELLNARYNDASLLTVISTERLMGEFLKLDQAVGSRICERAGDWYIPLAGKENWRLRRDGACD